MTALTGMISMNTFVIGLEQSVKQRTTYKIRFATSPRGCSRMATSRC
jgi:hypothetical protein